LDGTVGRGSVGVDADEEEEEEEADGNGNDADDADDELVRRPVLGTQGPRPEQCCRHGEWAVTFGLV